MDGNGKKIIIWLLPNSKIFKLTAINIRQLAEEIDKTGNELKFLDLGGGLGIPYNSDKTPSPKDLVSIIEEELKDRNEKIILEPGRSITGNIKKNINKLLTHLGEWKVLLKFVVFQKKALLILL